MKLASLGALVGFEPASYAPASQLNVVKRDDQRFCFERINQLNVTVFIGANCTNESGNAIGPVNITETCTVLNQTEKLYGKMVGDGLKLFGRDDCSQDAVWSAQDVVKTLSRDCRSGSNDKYSFKLHSGCIILSGTTSSGISKMVGTLLIFSSLFAW